MTILVPTMAVRSAFRASGVNSARKTKTRAIKVSPAEPI
jgi:hypothetical protein